MREFNYAWLISLTDKSVVMVKADELIILPNGAKFIAHSQESDLPDNIELSPDLADLLGEGEDYVIAFFPLQQIEVIQVVDQLTGGGSITDIIRSK